MAIAANRGAQIRAAPSCRRGGSFAPGSCSNARAQWYRFATASLRAARARQGGGLSALWLCRSVPAVCTSQLAPARGVARMSQTVERLRQRGWLTSRRSARSAATILGRHRRRGAADRAVARRTGAWAEGEQHRCQGVSADAVRLLEHMLPARNAASGLSGARRPAV